MPENYSVFLSLMKYQFICLNEHGAYSLNKKHYPITLLCCVLVFSDTEV